MRISVQERELVQKAADEAALLLPKLKEEREQLDRRIARLESYVHHAEELSGKKSTKEQTEESGGATAPSAANDTPKPRAKKGQALAHIEAVLNGGAAMDSLELIAAVRARFGIDYGRSTIYNALTKGVAKGRVVVDENKKWKRNELMIQQEVTR